jgi:hypothetical protein
MTHSKVTAHPEGERDLVVKTAQYPPIELDTYGGKIHVEWDPDATVTPIGQLPFFIQFLKLGQRFHPWVDDCPLFYRSNNAPTKPNVLGSLLLSVLSGHTRYAHLAAIQNDTVNPTLLGMTKVISDDSARRALKKIDAQSGVEWLQKHLMQSYEPLLKTPWILDVDVTVKPLFGHQEFAVKGYNPHKPGRPSHTYHTYMIANLRLILDVEVKAGNQSSSSYSMPGLMALLNKLDPSIRPEFVRGDCDWGNGEIMKELEEAGVNYLFKMKKSPKVRELISKEHGQGSWTRFNDGWEAKDSQIRLTGWDKTRRAVLIRRLLKNKQEIVLEDKRKGQLELAFIDGEEDMKAYEYSVLVTSLDDDVIAIVQHYRDRADCENNFDELKNQWGWGGYTTRTVTPCRLMARIIALIYNWWTLFVRLAEPRMHKEAITSRPLLLSSVGRLTKSGRQNKLSITPTHRLKDKVIEAYQLISVFFKDFKAIAPQLSNKRCWQLIIEKILSGFLPVTEVEMTGSPPT